MEARTNEQLSFLHPEGAVRHKARGLGVPVQAFSIRPSDNDSSIVSARLGEKIPEDLVLYCGRHDYRTRVLKNTGNLATVMKTMGHTDVKTAMQYKYPELEIVRAALVNRYST